MKFTYLLFLSLFLFSSIPTEAQKVLQMEKRGKIKTKKFQLGEELTFRLKDSKEWRTDVMIDIIVKEKLIVFAGGMVKVDDIKKIKSLKNARTAIVTERSLYSFGLSWLLFSLGGTLAGEPLNDLAWKVPVTSVGLGFLIRKIFYSRKYKIGKKRKLRVLDLSFNRDMQLGY